MTHSNTTQPQAFLYTRVSTEDQATHGHSLTTQKNVLHQFCQLRNITIRKEYVEDYSAKTFNRPEWKKLILEIEKSKVRPQLVLFTRWDRFSRNTGDSYYMIAKLKSLGVDAQAIEQPLDLSVPENKMMLAFYLTTPEVENDRRSLNIKRGMQTARERGKWTGRAPVGYANICLEDGTKSIVVKEPEASIIKQSFELLANSRCIMAEAYKKAVEAGLSCSQSNFYLALRNPVYMGYLIVKGSDENELVMGQHKGIVSVETFKKAQLVLEKPKKITATDVNLEFPFKGFIECPICGRLLTASASSGRSKSYAYYHCYSKCSFRIRAEVIFDQFMQRLNQLKPSAENQDLYIEIIKDECKNEFQKLANKKFRSIGGINQQNERIDKAKGLLLDSHITIDSYHDIKTNCEEKILILGETIDMLTNEQASLTNKINGTEMILYQLDDFFSRLTNPQKKIFLSLVLIKKRSDCANIDEMFHDDFKSIYPANFTNGSNDILDDNYSDGSETLRKLAQLVLSIENT